MQNIRKLRQSQKISQDKLSKILNVHQTAVSQWESGRTLPDMETAYKMAEYFNVSVNVIFDKEELYFSKPKLKGIKVPVLGSVAAGIPIEALEDIIDYEEITEEMYRMGKIVGLKIRGDSMEPDFRNGDIVMVLIQNYIENGEIAIVFVNGDEATCKKIKKTPQGVYLIPLNSTYEPFFFNNREIEELPVTIWGKVIELRRPY